MFALSWTTISIAGVAADLGCHKATPPQRVDMSKWDWTIKADQPLPTTRRSVTPLDAKTSPTPVADGPLPLVYLFESAGVVQVRDLTADQLLATSTISHNSTVAVDERRGVLVNGQAIATGPLSTKDRFAIFYSVSDGGDAINSARETNDPDILRWTHSGRPSATQSATKPVSATQR